MLELGRLFDWDIGDLGAAEDFDDLSGQYFCEELTVAWSVGGKAPFFRRFGQFINRWQVRRGGMFHNEVPMSIEERRRQNI
jgi:hypothetical protein